MNTKLKYLLIEKFKGIRELEISFSDKTWIRGQNASGKTTIMDAFTWLLYDEDSLGSSNFLVRPKDADGADIDNIEIKVVGRLSVDGTDVELTKTQKQKWVKKRGQEMQTFEGNVNEFQIDGFPAKKSEYEAKISSIIDKNLFKLLTNPRTFASMKWQDQRKMLLEFVSEITDKEILDTDVKYAPIAADVLAAGADKAKEKAQAGLKALKKAQAEYPVRIDEAMRSKEQVDMSEEEILQARIVQEAELEAIQDERDSLSAALKSVGEVQAQIINVKLKMGEIAARTDTKNSELARAAKDAVQTALLEVMDIERKRDRACDQVAVYQKSLSESTSEMENVKKTYITIRSRAMPHDETVCPTCGREFPSDRIAEVEKEFNDRKSRDLDRTKKKGDLLNAEIKSTRDKIDKLTSEIEHLTDMVAEADEKHKAAKKSAENVKVIDYRTIPEYKALEKQMTELEEKLATMDNGDAQKAALAQRGTDARNALNDLDAKLSVIASNKRADSRIEALRAEQRECSQKVADMEKLVYLLEEFGKAKMDMLSGRINSKFEKVRFRLFETQINGGIRETCTMQVNSNGSYVDYGSANNAARIIGGLDVIKALSRLYGVTAPIMIDNAEAINDYNYPEMDAQMIFLSVSDDKTLVVDK